MAKQDSTAPGTGAGAPTQQPAEQPASRAMSAAEVALFRRLLGQAIARETEEAAGLERTRPGSLMAQMHQDRADGMRHGLFCLDLILGDAS